jgi:NAD(P)H-nitrite reductase large subunit
MSTQYLIIGSGAAGMAAAEAIRSHDAHGHIVILSEEPHGYYSRPSLAYLLTNEIPEQSVYPFDARDLARLGVRLLHAPVAQLVPAAHEIILVNGTRLPYDRLLLATGAQAARLKAPGVDLQGVVKLDNLDDARQILKLARHARTAVVVGGGITALEIVEGLRARQVEVHYLLRGDRYWSNVLDETESRIVEARLQAEGVHLHYRTELAAILGDRGRVRAALTTAGEQIRCGIVAAAVGVLPRTELASAAGLRTERGVVVNEHLQSSAPDIFAAGDVAQVTDTRTGRALLDTLWSTALAQGRLAGLNMAGLASPYQRAASLNVTRLAGLTTTIIGAIGTGRREEDTIAIVRGDSESWRSTTDAVAAQTEFEVNRVRVMIGQQTLVGALVMGDQTLSYPLQHLIAGQVDISPIRDHLLAPDAPLMDIIRGYWESHRASAAKRPSVISRGSHDTTLA